MENCIEVKNLNKHYGKRVAVENLNLTDKKRRGIWFLSAGDVFYV
ncbi:MAG: hypothetical protein ACOH15_05565 [Acetobacterium sp.]